MFVPVMLAPQKKKMFLSEHIEQYSDMINNICLIGLVVCVILLIICLILRKRNTEVCEFQILFAKALMSTIVNDLERGIEPSYLFDDMETGMWSYNKMLYRFWVKKYRKMFYNPDLFDYVYNYAHSESEELKDEVYGDGRSV